MKLEPIMGSIGEPMFFENRIVCEWLDTERAASYLGISTNALRILVCRGKVKYFKYGRLLRFRTDDLRCLLKKGR